MRTSKQESILDQLINKESRKWLESQYRMHEGSPTEFLK